MSLLFQHSSKLVPQRMTWIDRAEADLRIAEWSLLVEDHYERRKHDVLVYEDHFVKYEPSTDIHRVRASDMFGVRYEDVTADQRRLAKNRYFGIDYGIRHDYT